MLTALLRHRLSMPRVRKWLRKSYRHVDPYEKSVDYATLPKADLILITHEHPDHYDKKALDKITKPDTRIIAAGSVVAAGLKGASVLKNGESTQWNDIRIDAVPAYNIEHKSPNGKPFHALVEPAVGSIGCPRP